MSFADAYDPIRALAASWRLLVRSPLPLLAGGVLLTLLGDGPRLGVCCHDEGWINPAAIFFAVCTFGFCCGIGGLLLSAWLSLGLANATEKTLVSGSARFEELFVSRGRFFDMVLVRVLRFAILLALAIPFFLVLIAGAILGDNRHVDEDLIGLGVVLSWLVYFPFYLFVGLGLTLAVQAVAIEGLQPTEALRRSWSLVRGNRLRLLVYWIALFVFTLIGLCLCCVGMLGTGALAQIAANESYLELIGRTAPAVPPPAPAS
jgi:hypothetical protein